MTKRVEKNKEIIQEIEDEKIKTRNKKIVKVLLWIFIPLFSLLISFFILIRYVGNIGIVIREYPIESKYISKDLDGLKIIHFSCIHYNNYTSNKKISKLVEMINNTNPDIIIFTGDLIDKNYKLQKSEKEFLIAELNKLNSTIGKYAIKGEDKDNVIEIYDSSNFKLLNNTNEELYINKSIINLTAVEKNYNLEGIKINKDADYSITLTHYPDQTDDILNNINTDLILSGHSHNGQINLPFIGRIIKKEGSKKYFEPFYSFNNTDLYISGGLGNNGLPLRLFNHPNINFYRLRYKK